VVQSLFASVFASGGLVVMKKFGKNCDQVSLILSVFSDLCTQLKGSANFWQDLRSEFGSDEFNKLAGALPDVMKLAPHHESKGSLTQVTSGKLSLVSLCGIMKRFVRIISTTCRPILLVLDDIHWSNTEILGFIHGLLTDQRKAMPIFLVGCYLIEHEDAQGILPGGTGSGDGADEHCLHGFDQWLLASNVPVHMVRLGNMSEEGVNSMISESLSMMPRLSHSLAQVVFSKTDGNPLQIRKVLRSLGES
jgi:predicted ATPase